MKHLLLLACVLSSLFARAQFFQYRYGSTLSTIDDDRLQYGANTRIVGNGYLMSGTSFNRLSPNIGLYRLAVVKTDASGTFTSPNDFEHDYILYDGAGYQIDVDKAEAIEINPSISSTGAQYAVIGSASETVSGGGVPKYYLFYLELDNTGTPMGSAALYYLGASPNDYETHFSNARASISGQYIYAVGNCHDVTSINPDRDGFIVKFNITTAFVTITWSSRFSVPAGSSYDVTLPNDVIESPYVTNPDVIVVGECLNGTVSDGFVQEFNQVSGATSGNAWLYGSTAEDNFQAINIMNSGNPVPGGGFVVGGNTRNGASPGATHGWVCFFTQPMGLSISSQLFVASVHVNLIYDIKERLNTAGRYEYYTNGYFRLSNAAVGDMLVFKFSLLPLSVTGFRYGTTAGDESGRTIDYYDGLGLPNGISAYGNTNGFGTTPGDEFYKVKSYFNGVNPCSTIISASSRIAGPTSTIAVAPVSAAGFSQQALVTVPYNNMAGNVICTASSVSGGSNARNYKPQADPTGGNELAGPGSFTIDPVQPNPATPGAPVLLTVSGTTETEVRITVTDLLGRSFEAGSYRLAKGNNSIQLDLNSLHLNKGLYLLQVQSDAYKQSTMLYVE